MAGTFKTTNCLPSTTSSFSDLKYDTSSYSCSWDSLSSPSTEFATGGSIPVYLQVLAKYNIPVSIIGTPPRLGSLPGIDINRMSAIEAITLSLAENFLNGEWWEIVEDGEGGVIIQLIYKSGNPGKVINLNPRMCIPTATKTSDIDMVIVTGYDRRDFRDVIPKGSGSVNPVSIPDGMFTIDESALFDTCHKRQLQHTCTKSYPDPLVQDSGIFQGQVSNPFFDPKAFEKLVTWVMRITGLPLANKDAALVKHSFSETTSWLYEVTQAVTFTKVTDVTPVFLECNSDTITGGTVEYYQAKITIPNQTFIDKYGDQWPLIIKPTGVIYMGYKLTTIVALPSQGNLTVAAYVEPTPELIKMDEGSQWVYVLKSNGDFEITMYYQPKKEPGVWEATLASLSTTNNIEIKVDDHSGNYGFGNDKLDLGLNMTPVALIGGTAGLGYLATGIWIDFEIDRPSVTLTTLDGSPARPYCNDFRMEYAPIILFDPPAEKAYVHKNGAAVELDLQALSLSLADNDPTTCQNFENTPEGLMNDLMEGNVVNVTLPFCRDAAECLQVARTIFNYQSYGQANKYALTCGPEDDPELGAAVFGYDTNLRIDSINYSYSHGSSYSIEVSLGPVFASIGSWNTGTLGGKYESVDRSAIVVWSGGDGVNYRVDIQGLGEYTAINGQKDVWRVGERVKVKLHNVPTETI